MPSAFPPTCQKERRCSPWRLCKLQEIERKLWQQVKIRFVTCHYFCHLLKWCTLSRWFKNMTCYNLVFLFCSESLPWTRWLLVSGNISMSCLGRNFSTNSRGHSTRTSWPTTRIHLCLRSTALLTYSDSLVKTHLQNVILQKSSGSYEHTKLDMKCESVAYCRIMW